MRRLFLSAILILSFTWTIPVFSKEESTATKVKDSIFGLTTTFTDQTGKTGQLKTWKNEYTIMTMVYTRCGYSCPTMVSKLKLIESKLSKELLSKTNFILGSFDPDHDTPSILKSFKKSKELGDHWYFITSIETKKNAKEDTMRTLSNVLNITYNVAPDNNITHSNAIVLLNSDGVVIARVKELNASVDELVEKINGTQKNKPHEH